ncbi:hypothetical protein C1N87_31180 (plasmid) [Priestia aryabhattai]
MLFMCFLAVAMALILLIIMNNTKNLSLESKVAKRFKTQLKVLGLTPFLAIIILSLVIYNFHSLYEERISHALLVLSGWVMVTSSLFLMKYLKSHKKSYWLSLVLAVCSLGMAIFLTPLDRYAFVFHKNEYVIAIIIGGCLITLNYINLFRLKRVVSY